MRRALISRLIYQPITSYSSPRIQKQDRLLLLSGSGRTRVQNLDALTFESGLAQKDIPFVMREKMLEANAMKRALVFPISWFFEPAKLHRRGDERPRRADCCLSCSRLP